ncbi:MAG: hypothetical protein IMZ63_00175 [Actinobacteria bacterium]|nr:hypothetical protein [Actinomycetota bacterium]
MRRTPLTSLYIKLLFAELLKLAYDILIISKDIPTQGNPEELDIENINSMKKNANCSLKV